MYTMERYMKEHLSPRESFYPPSENFRPSEEMSREVIYHSPLLEGDPAQPPGVKPRKSPEEKSVIFLHSEDDADKHFMIDEKATIDELISQIRDSGKFKE